VGAVVLRTFSKVCGLGKLKLLSEVPGLKRPALSPIVPAWGIGRYLGMAGSTTLTAWMSFLEHLVSGVLTNFIFRAAILGRSFLIRKEISSVLIFQRCHIWHHGVK